MGFSLSSERQSFEVAGTVAPPCQALSEQEELFPRARRVAAYENTPLRKNWGAVCSDGSYAVTLPGILSLSMIKK